MNINLASKKRITEFEKIKQFINPRDIFFFVILILIFLSRLSLEVRAEPTAAVMDHSGNIQPLYFTGQSTSPNKWYQDAISTNPDVGIQICSVGQKYVGATYAINISGVWKYVPITYKSSTETLAYTDVDKGSGCYFTSPAFLTFSPSYLTTPNPPVYYAAYPGKLWIGYADTSNPGTINNFIFAGNNGQLLGSYNVERSFSEGTGEITVQTPTIIFQTPSGSFNKLASDSQFGVSNERRLVVGACIDDHGASCADGYIVPNEKNFPLSLNSGLSSAEVNDQHAYTKYIVINGIGNPICIGPNLKVSIDSITPNPIYYGQTLNIEFTISNPRDTPYETNGGNVGVTSSFDIRISIYNSSNPSDVIYQTTQTISDDISPDGIIRGTASWLAQAHSGEYTVKIDVDYNDNIVECNEADNSATKNFELKPIFVPNIQIDETNSTSFPYPGVPYNLSLHLMNSDGENVSNATIRIVEENGINVFGPTQIWNRSISNTTKEKAGLKSYNIAEFKTDYMGRALITIIPTGNKLYSPEYNYTNLSEYVGDYKIYLKGWTQEGDELIFTISGNIKTEYPLSIEHPYEYENSNNKEIPNKNNFVQPIMEFVYEIFSTFWKSLI